ncbi:MAG: 3-oxoacyl-ACP reductase [Alcaligenaceae bacterium]|nr:3-oxoacyl-ACP reductase [Alcaligenaceae bacterium]
MDLGIAGKTAVITASSKGIGKECAWALAREGANVVVCARNVAQLEQTAQELAAEFGSDRVLAVPTDIMVQGDLDRLVTAVNERFGSVDILVYITGSPKRGGFSELTADDLRAAFEMTVIPAWQLLHLVLPSMREQGWGRIVTVQSRSVKEPIPNLVSSIATRPGVAGLFKYVADEVAADGVLLNVIVPGRIETDRFRAGVEGASAGQDAYVQSKLSDLPVGRFGRPQEIADTVCFLSSERASYISGSAIKVDGGVIRAL